MSDTGWPVTAGNFGLVVDGVTVGYYQEVSGLAVSVAVETVVEGGQNQYAHKLPGAMSWPNIVLKRGLTDSDALFTWIEKTSGTGFASAGSKVERASGAITMYSTFSRSDGTGAPLEVLRQWSFQGAFPVRWNGPSFAAGSNELAVEELEIAHHGFAASR